MPTYQYACTACGHQLEAVQSFADDPLTECPACEGRLRKLYSAVGIVFKGSGFYRTDSRNGGKTGGSASRAEVRVEVRVEVGVRDQVGDEDRVQVRVRSPTSSSSTSPSSKSAAPAGLVPVGRALGEQAFVVAVGALAPARVGVVGGLVRQDDKSSVSWTSRSSSCVPT